MSDLTQAFEDQSLCEAAGSDSDVLAPAGEAQRSNWYYLGQVILYAGPDARIEIFDGLQRLTSLTVLICVLRDLIEDTDWKARLSASIADQQGAWCLVAPGNDTTLSELIQRPGEAAKVRYPSRRAGLSDMGYRILRVQGAVLNGLKLLAGGEPLNSKHEGVKEQQQARLVAFARFLLEQVFFTVVHVSDEHLARQIFVSSNARGIRLDPVDILKGRLAEIMEGAQDAALVTQKWDAIRRDAGADFVELLRCMDAIERAKPQRSGWEIELGDHVAEKVRSEGLLAWLDRLALYCRAFVRLRETLLNGGSDKLEQDVFRLSVFLWFEWRPLAVYWLAMLEPKEGETVNAQRRKMIEDRFDLLHRRAMALTLAQQTNQQREKFFLKALSIATKNNGNPFNQNGPLTLQESQRLKAHRTLATPLDDDRVRACLVKWLEIARWREGLPALMRGDDDLNSKRAPRPASVEHILPKNPPPDSRWLELFPTDRAWYRNCHALGNLALVSCKANDEAENKDFVLKKPILAAQAPSFDLVQSVIEHDHWDEQAIESRTQSLLVKIWEELAIGERPLAGADSDDPEQVEADIDHAPQ
ncbi:MAG: DUF262 domain-containing HNH endonuclease family protein [Neomegalonema sp.]|nr:DUF262 domain-containing HNH endonuclease family protein [Neomegalonema sp.]